jgi:hypothetical protein
VKIGNLNYEIGIICKHHNGQLGFCTVIILISYLHQDVTLHFIMFVKMFS